MEDADLHSAARSQFRGELPSRLGVAVSGGGDSVALLHILLTSLKDEPVEIFAATVDHGLRPESHREAKQVATLCDQLGIEHTTLRWQNWDGQGNLQDQARRARYQLLTDWAKTCGIPVLALGHTADDQAETVLMRLARASGVSGLAAMPVRRTENGVMLFRPLLGVTRAELRSYLKRRGQSWVDDPSNDDTGYERIRMRQAFDVLEPLGLSVPVLARVADNMSRAREALDWYTFLAARELVEIRGGAVTFDIRCFRTHPNEISRRLLIRALSWVGATGYAPRQQPVEEALEAIRNARSYTLNGCRIVCRGGRAWICRELQAVREKVERPGLLWDQRWILHGGRADCKETVGVLGQEGLLQCPNWRDQGLPREVLLATPALWRGDTLVSAPLAGYGNGWTAELEIGDEEFFASLLSH
ncbi:MAG: tRNA lysidine(34) synthetase TilS [Paracoccaceae bacterium]